MSSKYDHRKTKSNLNLALAFTLTLPLPLTLPLTPTRPPTAASTLRPRCRPSSTCSRPTRTSSRGARPASASSPTSSGRRPTYAYSRLLTCLLTNLRFAFTVLPFVLASVLTHSLARGRRPTRAARPSVSSRCRRAWPTSATRWRSSRRRVRSTRRGWRSSCSASCASRRCG